MEWDLGFQRKMRDWGVVLFVKSAYNVKLMPAKSDTKRWLLEGILQFLLQVSI